MKPDNIAETRSESLFSGLQRALRKGLVLHGASCLFGLLPAVVFIRRAYLFFSRRLLFLFFSFLALGYFPTVCLCTSLALGLLSFSLRQTATIEHVLNRVCDRVVAPLLEKLPSSAQDAEVSVAELDARVQAGADAIFRDESGKFGAGPARSLAGFALRIALAVLKRVAKRKFKAAMVPKTSGGPLVVTMQTAVVALQGELVSIVLSPFKNTMRMYFCAALAISLALIYLPLRMVL